MFSLEKLAIELDAVLEGNIKYVNRLSPFDLAEEGDLTFAADQKYLKELSNTKAQAVLIPDVPGLPLPQGKTYLKVKKAPRELMPILLKFFKPKTKMPVKAIEDSATIGEGSFVGPGAYIGHNAVIGANCSIYPNVSIMEGAIVGDNAIIYPGAVIREFCKVGNNVIIHPCAVVGADGFGFVKVNGHNVKIEQIGIVQIEDDVEIGGNTTIDRGTIGNTIIKRGTKLDNLVHIAHNVVIGEEGLLTAQTGIAGSTVVGKNFVMGGQSGVTGHIKVGDNVTVGSRSGVASTTDGNQVIAGFPAIDYNTDRKVKVSLKRLPEMLKRLKKIEQKLKMGDGNEEN